MALAKFVQEGHTIDCVPDVDLPAGEVYIRGDLVGVTKAPILANTLGPLGVTGVFDFPKATAQAIPFGTTCHWDLNALQAVTVAADGLIGKCVRDAAVGETTVRIRLFQ